MEAETSPARHGWLKSFSASSYGWGSLVLYREREGEVFKPLFATASTPTATVSVSQGAEGSEEPQGGRQHIQSIFPDKK